MTVHYAVTYEFATRAPVTLRGTVAGAKVTTCVSRAVKAARADLHPQAWTSLVCVLLERVDSEQGADAPRAAAAVDPREDSNTGTPTTREWA